MNITKIQPPSLLVSFCQCEGNWSHLGRGNLNWEIAFIVPCLGTLSWLEVPSPLWVVTALCKGVALYKKCGWTSKGKKGSKRCFSVVQLQFLLSGLLLVLHPGFCQGWTITYNLKQTPSCQVAFHHCFNIPTYQSRTPSTNQRKHL